MKFRIPFTNKTFTDQPEVKEKAITEDILGGFLNMSTGLSSEKDISTKLLAANRGWVYRNNDVIAKNVSELEFQLFRVRPSTSEVKFEPVEDHPILDLLDKFNDQMNRVEGVYQTESHINLAGDSFWYLTGGDLPDGIFLLQPDKVTLDINNEVGSGTDRLVNSYKYKDNVDGKQIEISYDPEEIIHFKAPNPSNPFRGLSKVEAAAQAIDTDNLAVETSKNFFKNGAITNFVLTTENKLTEEQIRRMRAELSKGYSGAQNAYKAMILGSGLKPEKLQMTNKDMEFLAQQEWLRDKIMITFGNTKASLGIIDDVNRASHESSVNSWMSGTVRPDMARIVNTLNEFLVPKFGEDLVLGFENPVKEDKLAKAESLKSLVESGIMTPDEARKELELEEMGGDAENLRSRAPVQLQYIDLKKHLRRLKMYQKQRTASQVYKQARKIAEQKVKSDKPIPEKRLTPQFTNDKVWEYWEKQIRIVESVEEPFERAVRRFIEDNKELILQNFPEETPLKHAKALFNEEERIKQAEDSLVPYLVNVAQSSGIQARALINFDDPFIVDEALRSKIAKNVRKFTRSMLETEREKIISIIENGLRDGKGTAVIRREIQAAFEGTDTIAGFTKTQADRIARTEVLLTSNLAAEESWASTGVVKAKQWLTARDDRVDLTLCAPLDGKIIPLKSNYFNRGEKFNGVSLSYRSIGEPPIHPGCRCTLLPVIDESRAYQPEWQAKAELLSKRVKQTEDEKKKMQERIKELESEIDKRTKEYRDIKHLKSESDEYIKELEKLVEE